LMCETRRDFKLARTSYIGKTPESTTEEVVASPRASKPRAAVPRSRGEGPRDEKSEWTTVVKPASGRGRGRPPRSVPASTST